MNVLLEKARAEDYEDIAQLVNVAYRGDVGWARESALISGDRVEAEQIKNLLLDANIHFLVAYRFR